LTATARFLPSGFADPSTTSVVRRTFSDRLFMMAIIGRAGDEKVDATQQWADEDK
jgi:hypothetical protein